MTLSMIQISSNVCLDVFVSISKLLQLGSLFDSGIGNMLNSKNTGDIFSNAKIISI